MLRDFVTKDLADKLKKLINRISEPEKMILYLPEKYFESSDLNKLMLNSF